MTIKLSDEQLILEYSKGHIGSFELLYERHKGALFRYCLRHFQNIASAEECFQEVWLKIIKNRQKYRPTALFTTYLYRIAQNTLIDHYRKEKKRSQDREFDEQIEDEDRNQSGSDFEINEESKVQVRLLRKKIAELPFEQRNTLLLKLNSNLSLEEIASILDCGKETVKSRLRYATNRLKGILSNPHCEKFK